MPTRLFKHPFASVIVAAVISAGGVVASYALNAKIAEGVRSQLANYQGKDEAKEHEANLKADIVELKTLAKDSNDRIQKMQAQSEKMQGQLELLLKDKRLVQTWEEIRAAARWKTEKALE